LENEWQIDFSYTIPGRARFRVNAFYQRATVGAAFRLIPTRMPQLKDLGVPAVLEEFTKKPRGFVLVTGPTGSGKSTTLAAMLDLINTERHEHILTIEDPIEFLHPHKGCIVNQREIGSDAQSFALGLKAALREDPDVILVGEMRDLETIGTALTAAETGHLVFATLHTQDCAQTVDRIIDVFPPSQQDQVRVQLSVALQGVAKQQMSTFAYKALDPTGTTIQGEIEADDKVAVASQLRSRGLIVVDIDEQGAGQGDIFARFKKVKPDELTVATRQFSTMVSSGMSMLRALYVLEEQQDNPKLKDAFSQVRKDVEAGLALSDALGRHPDIFNELYIAMVKAGETGGILEETLHRVADQLEKDASLRRQIKSAMVYPIVIISFATIVVLALVAFLIPVFEGVFKDFGGKLPA